MPARPVLASEGSGDPETDAGGEADCERGMASVVDGWIWFV